MTTNLIEQAKAILAQIEARPNDAPLPTEYLLDEAAALIRQLIAQIEGGK